MLESGRPGDRRCDTLVLHRVCLPPQTGADAKAWITVTIIRRIVAVSQSAGDVSRTLPLGLLAPDIVEAILAGRQPVELTAKRLKRIRDLPVSWAEQRRALGFS